MDALRGMSVGERWWSGEISRVIVSVRTSALQESREALQERSRTLVAFVRADIWRSLCSFLLYVYCSDGGMQASRAGWELVVGSHGGAAVIVLESVREASRVTGILQMVL